MKKKLYLLLIAVLSCFMLVACGESEGNSTEMETYEYDNSGDGFSFSNYNADEMLSIINYSKHIYYDRKRQWNQMIERGMKNDFSWNASKFRYEGLYNYLLGE